MLVSRKADKNKLGERKMLKPLTLAHLVNCLGELKKHGYFYGREDVLSTEAPCITMGNERELLHLAPEWNAEKLTQSGPENEDKIMLKETEIVKLDEYLNEYRRLDSILESVGKE